MYKHQKSSRVQQKVTARADENGSIANRPTSVRPRLQLISCRHTYPTVRSSNNETGLLGTWFESTSSVRFIFRRINFLHHWIGVSALCGRSVMKWFHASATSDWSRPRLQAYSPLDIIKSSALNCLILILTINSLFCLQMDFSLYWLSLWCFYYYLKQLPACLFPARR